MIPNEVQTIKSCLNLLDQRKQEYTKSSKIYKSFFKSNLYEDKENNVNNLPVPKIFDPENVRVFFDISIGNEFPKRVEFELFSKKLPITTENFRALCTGEKSTENLKLHFKNSIFHRVIKGFMMQGGDFENANGTGGSSIYGRKFNDENFLYTHTEGGLLSMANSGVNTNGSQFFVTFKETPWLDGKHVVFGRVVSGLDVILDVEKVEAGEQDRPNLEIKIVDCGEINLQI